jgi:hypothetical protein
MEFIGKHRLVAHPLHPPTTVRSVEVSLWIGTHLSLAYGVEPAGALVLPDHGHERIDGLWRGTCFELFVKPGEGSAYHEFNFSPAAAWNAYSFSDWRQGMEPLEVDAPFLVDCRLDDPEHLFPGRYQLDVVLSRASTPATGGKISLASVIEEEDGTLSYWALTHPPGEPDFHHPDCFAFGLPAARPDPSGITRD